MLNPHYFNAILMTAKVMKRSGYDPKKGLGHKGQGMRRLIEFEMKEDTFGLGFKPTRADRARMAQTLKERRLARLEGRVAGMGRLIIKSLQETFVSTGLWTSNQVAVIAEGSSSREKKELVKPSKVSASSWTVKPVPVVYNLKEM